VNKVHTGKARSSDRQCERTALARGKITTPVPRHSFC